MAAEFETRVPLSSGHYQIRAGVLRGNRIATVIGSADVPAVQPVGMSGVMLSTTDGTDRLSSPLGSDVITARRAFSTSEVLNANVAIAWSSDFAGSIPIRVTVADATAKVVYTRDEVVATDDGSGGKAFVSAKVPLAELGPGAYSLAVEAAVAGHTILRRVPCTVER